MTTETTQPRAMRIICPSARTAAAIAEVLTDMDCHASWCLSIVEDRSINPGQPVVLAFCTPDEAQLAINMMGF